MKKFTPILFSVLLIGCVSSSDNSSYSNVGLEQKKESESIYLEDRSEFILTASSVETKINGKKSEMLAYNGSIPGPTIVVDQGSKIYLDFINKLNQDSSLHSHGLRLQNKFDGVPGVTQDEILPGESFQYELDFPDAGVYFYHPHTREDYQQEMGLYGAFVVLPNDESEFGVELKKDHEVVFLDDLELDLMGKIAVTKDAVQKTLMGRFGNKMFINGELNSPIDLGQFKAGEEKLVTFVNTANVRPFNLQIEGVEMELIASDNSAFQKSEVISNLIIGPSERYTVRLRFLEEGDFVMRSVGGFEDYEIVKLKVDGLSEVESIDFSGLNLSDEQIGSFLNKEVDKSIILSMNMSDEMMHGGMMSMPCHQMPDGSWMGDCENAEHSGDGIEWEDEMFMMNEMSNTDNVEWKIIDNETGKTGMDIDWNFNKGDYVKISIKNDESSMHPMQHPFHVHGQRFLVIAKNGEINDNLVWKDTTMIPAGETYEVLVEMSNVGEWVAHCHIPEHMEAGMMMKFTVDD